MTRFVALINTPGYLPEEDDPPTFDAASEAWAHLADERKRHEDDVPDWPADRLGEYTDTWRTLDYIARGGHQHGSPHEDTPTGSDGTGVVYGDTPGYHGRHDQGRAYSVALVAADESEDEGCEGHPAGPSDPMGETVYCDGSCRA